MKAENIKPWLFRVQPYEGESLSHFLGRFRRANDLTSTGLGKAAEVGVRSPDGKNFGLIPHRRPSS